MSPRRLATHTLAALAALVLAVAVPAHADAALDDVAREVDRTESLRAVLNLQRTYAQYAQAGLWTEVGALFAPDGRFVFDGLIKPEQTAKGPAAIAAFLRTRYGGGYEGLRADGLSTMMIDAPVANLAVDGNSAKVRWETWTFHGAGGQARIEGGVFENDYVRQSGVWKIAEAHYYPEFDGAYDSGWTNWGGGTLPVVPRHYTVDAAGIPIPPAIGTAPKSSLTLAALQARVDRLNDEDRVRNLQSAYGFYQDRKMWDDVVDLIAADGVVEVGGEGVWTGKAGVRRWLETMGPAGLRHGQLNDRVQFDVTVEIAPGGNEAWARGIELGMLGEADQEKGWWEVATFKNRFVKEGGVWKVRELRRFPLMKTDVFQGWGKGRIVAGVDMPAFLGTHPVTGKQVLPAGDARLVAASALTGAIATGKAAAVTLAEAKRRLARSAAFDGVMNVSAAYGHFLDDEHPAGFIGVLATKGFKGGRTGYYVTKASNLKARVQSDPPTTREGISYHWLIQPVVLISDDGRSATARLRLFQPRTGKTVGKAGDFFAASVLASTYHDGYVLEDGVWRIWDLTVDPQYIRPVAFKDGLWAKAKDPAQPDPNAPPRVAAPSRAARNDITAEDLGAKRSTVQWPGIMPMWFGYTNPVSGRVPELYQPDCVPCGIRPDLRFDRNGYQQPPNAPEANRSSGVMAQRDGEAAPPATARAAYSRFAGFYKLLATEGRGYLAYDPAGYVSMTTQGPDRPSPAALSGYAAYFGTFAVNDAVSTITHQIFGALQPRFSVADQVQRFTMSGNRLTLDSPKAAHDIQSTLSWERVPDLPNLTARQRQLIGFWKLVSTERRFTKDGGLARAYPGWTGFIVYAASGHMMVHMMEPYRRRYAGDAPTPEEARATSQSYTSYFGTYTITGAGSLVHHFEGSINRGSVGTDTQRFFEVSGNKLILRPPLIKTPEGDVIMTNVWERLTD